VDSKLRVLSLLVASSLSSILDEQCEARSSNVSDSTDGDSTDGDSASASEVASVPLRTESPFDENEQSSAGEVIDVEGLVPIDLGVPLFLLSADYFLVESGLL
jgi:hypothetical protein